MILNGVMVFVLHNFTKFGNFRASYSYIKVVKDTPKLCATEMYSEESTFQQYIICRYSRRLPRKIALKTSTCAQKQKFEQYCVVTWKKCEIGLGCILVLFTDWKWHMQHCVWPSRLCLFCCELLRKKTCL